MELAQRSGFLVPNSKIMKMGGHELFVVDRYDRLETNKEIIRIHQEDFCQAMGYPVERKYQETGGPGFVECRELIEEFLLELGHGFCFESRQKRIFCFQISTQNQTVEMI